MELTEPKHRTEPKYNYTSAFPNTLTPKMAKNRKKRVYLSTNAILALFHVPPLLRNPNDGRYELESCKQI